MEAQDFQKLLAYVKANNELTINFNYDDKVCTKTLLDIGIENYIDSIYDNNIEYLHEEEIWHIKYACQSLDIDFCELTDSQIDELRGWYSWGGVADWVKSQAAYCRVVMYSNYDCLSISGAEVAYEGYITQMGNILGLNPQALKKALIGQGFTPVGKWPTKKNKGLVNENEFALMLANLGHFGNLTFYFEASIGDIYKTKQAEKITIKKGTPLMVYADWIGQGPLEWPYLANDLTINIKHGQTEHDKFSVLFDAESGYSIQECYDFISSEWKKGGFKF